MPEQNEPHRTYWDALLERVVTDPYPSTRMLDMLERDMRDDERARLVEALVDKIKGDRFPSPTMWQRIARIAR
jgi:hypothetical protein